MTTPKEWLPSPAPPPEVRWTNATSHTQYVDVLLPSKETRLRGEADGTVTTVTIDTQKTVRVTWAPGETRSLPASLCNAIHMCFCAEPSCAGKRCGSPMTHRGAHVMGGLAPLMTREGQTYGLHRGLVPVAKDPYAPTIAVDEIPAALERRGSDGEDPALARARARRSAK